MALEGPWNVHLSLGYSVCINRRFHQEGWRRLDGLPYFLFFFIRFLILALPRAPSQRGLLRLCTYWNTSRRYKDATTYGFSGDGMLFMIGEFRSAMYVCVPIAIWVERKTQVSSPGLLVWLKVLYDEVAFFRHVRMITYNAWYVV